MSVQLMIGARVFRYLQSLAARIRERKIGEAIYHETRRLQVQPLTPDELILFAELAAENRGHN